MYTWQNGEIITAQKLNNMQNLSLTPSIFIINGNWVLDENVSNEPILKLDTTFKQIYNKTLQGVVFIKTNNNTVQKNVGEGSYQIITYEPMTEENIDNEDFYWGTFQPPYGLIISMEQSSSQNQYIIRTTATEKMLQLAADKSDGDVSVDDVYFSAQDINDYPRLQIDSQIESEQG